MSTSTLSFWASALTSTISPSKSESGPDVTLTDSPRENSTCARGAAAPPGPPPAWRIRSTSACESGEGFAPAPTNAVTPGVPLTTVQASSFRSMLTSTYPGSTRFSICTFCPSFVSITCSVGTTTRRKRGAWFIETIRCSRLAFTLFSCPEYVLITYQRNMCLLPQENVADEGLEDLVGRVEVGADDHAGDDHDDRALHHLGAARPLDLLQLGPGLADEA